MLPKAKAGARPVILSGDAQKLLRGQLGAHSASEWVFPGPDGRPYERSYVSRNFRKGARMAVCVTSRSTIFGTTGRRWR